MNFEKIVLESRYEKDIEAYFIKEYEKIEKSRNAPKFFPNCHSIIKNFTKGFYRAFEEKKILLNYQIQKAKNNEFNFQPTIALVTSEDKANYNRKQNLALCEDLQKEFNELDVLKFVTRDNGYYNGFSLVELTVLEIGLLKAIDLITETNSLKQETFINKDDKYIIELSKIIASHNKFNNVLFDINFNEYLSIWNYNKEPKKIDYLDKQLAKFIYFLEQIPEIKTKEALRFGIKNYNQRKNRHKPTPVFRNDVRNVLK